MKSISSRIDSVTVFSNQAQILRKATITLPAGSHKVEFTDLSLSIDNNSIQLAGKGNVMIRGVKPRNKQLINESNEDLKALIDEKERLESEQRKIHDRANRLKKQKDFIDAIQKRVTAPIEHASMNELSPESWQNMLNFQVEQMEKIDAAVFETEEELKENQKALEFVKRKINQFNRSSAKTVKVVEVDLELEEEEELELYLSYLVQNAGWIPLYDLRVNTEREDILVIYQAMVRQSTGEDWTDVNVSLSTAKPHVYGKPPEINPHFLRKYMPPPAAKPRSRSMSRERGGKMLMAKKSSAPEPQMEMDVMEEAMISQTVMRPASTVKENATSVIFDITEPMSLSGNNEPEQIRIFQTQLSAKFSHETVPALSPYAFLRTEITNDSNYPLLAGQANVYMDGHYVSQTNLDFIASEQNFEVHLGVDENVKVEHKVIGSLRKTEGFIGPKKEKQTFKSQITITNRKKNAVSIEVKDRYPFSQDNDIKVELIQPSYKEDTDQLKIDEQNILTFSRKLSAGEEWEIPIEYHVSYPKDVKVEGL